MSDNLKLSSSSDFQVDFLQSVLWMKINDFSFA